MLSEKIHSHGDGATHSSVLPDIPLDSDTDQNSDHCEQCCHGHLTNLIYQAIALTPIAVSKTQCLTRTSKFRNLAQTPPTPPPNA